MDKKNKTRKMAVACYDHIGGKLGELIFKLLIDKEWINKVPNSRDYGITNIGWQGFNELGIDTSKLKSSSRIPVSPCVERFSGNFYEHTGAHLGSLLTTHLITLGWLIPKPEKEYEITVTGRREMANLGLKLENLK